MGEKVCVSVIEDIRVEELEYSVHGEAIAMWIYSYTSRELQEKR